LLICAPSFMSPFPNKCVINIEVNNSLHAMAQSMFFRNHILIIELPANVRSFLLWM
jgi:hypothetical protein